MPLSYLVSKFEVKARSWLAISIKTGNRRKQLASQMSKYSFKIHYLSLKHLLPTYHDGISFHVSMFLCCIDVAAEILQIDISKSGCYKGEWTSVLFIVLFLSRG